MENIEPLPAERLRRTSRSGIQVRVPPPVRPTARLPPRSRLPRPSRSRAVMSGGTRRVDGSTRVLDARLEAPPRLHAIANLGEHELREARRQRRTSHSSDALQVPSPRRLRPPFTHTTAVAAISCESHLGTGRKTDVLRLQRHPTLRGRPESRADIASHQRRPRRRNSRDVAVPPRPPPGYSGRSPATQMYRERGPP